MHRWAGFLLCFFVVSVGYAQHTSTLRCENRLVSLGDTPRQVQDKCGPPVYIDTTLTEKIDSKYVKTKRDVKKDGFQTEVPEQVEKTYDLQNDYRLIKERKSMIERAEWTYNFGSSRFIQTLMFENDELVSIQTGSYGYDSGLSQLSSVQEGDSRAMVMMKYGKPLEISKRPQTETRVTYKEKGDILYVEHSTIPLDEEVWLYDFGPNRFQEKLFFKANQLMKVEKLEEKGTIK